jgi:hypothetical protein
MTVQSWDTSLIGIDPAGHARSVLVVPGADAIVDEPALAELRRWGWTVSIVEPDTDPDVLGVLGLQHDVALFPDIRGTRITRRTLTPILPTVAIVPPRGRGRAATLLGEAGARRDTTVLIVRDSRDVKVLRRLSGSALVRLEAADSARGRAMTLASVLLRAHAWYAGPLPTPVPLGAVA